ncbi:Mediator of RNA polymerase II transcription subunit-like protein [Hapsidospora chrysogenum ATCC 11550]|uniref:Mediator of RNA polymerase II transcription subunit 7 n=1 Tax=Hapsidospora chrysogenum (strain ATCC 11550 / CBS 779.69 / DSM 880 / IAM 14645 / JCM 23072 / IMI 49137) TaxID=857340 RepID=A0A086T3Q1_HAPC1|nr:Mediator of RNA polymerase II transcription subunit-like protein [Hapsidospora chrysogenum ATCC 11550]
MADQEEPHSLASTFPNPPPFWKDFTPENIARIEELRSRAQGHDGDGGETPPARIPGVPEDLTNLQPPAEPKDGRWRVFGDHYMLDDKLPTLEEQGITNLALTHPARTATNVDVGDNSTGTGTGTYTHHDHALELKRLVKSLLLNFLELVGTLASNPAHAADKVEDLRTLLINTHHALNEYRPHQARESAAEMMQYHLDRIRGETAAVRAQVENTRKVLRGLADLSVPEVPPGVFEGLVLEDGDRTEEEWNRAARERDAEVWAATDALLA